MNLLTLKEFNNAHVVYFYQPDGKGGKGEVDYSFTDKTAIVVVRAEEDNNAEHYGYKAARKIEEVVSEKNLPLEFIQAWY